MNKVITRYLTIWQIYAKVSLQKTLINRWTTLLFFVGKIVRIVVTLFFLLLIRNNVEQFSGYTTDQVLVFFIIYNIVDITSQIAFRGIYMFGHGVRNGQFDSVLARPVNSLFQALMSEPDLIDTLFLLPVLGVSAYLLSTIELSLSVQSLLLFAALLINSFLIVTALHIFVLVGTLLSTDIDGLVWLYRDLNELGQFPVSIYVEPLRFALFFIIPVGMMVTIPAEVISGAALSQSVALCFGVGVVFFSASLYGWRYALRFYGSASS